MKDETARPLICLGRREWTIFLYCKKKWWCWCIWPCSSEACLDWAVRNRTFAAELRRETLEDDDDGERKKKNEIKDLFLNEQSRLKTIKENENRMLSELQIFTLLIAYLCNMKPKLHPIFISLFKIACATPFPELCLSIIISSKKNTTSSKLLRKPQRGKETGAILYYYFLRETAAE